MALQMDPEVLASLSRSGPMGQPRPAVGDVESRRKNFADAMAAANSGELAPGIDRTDVVTEAADGADLRLFWYRNATVEHPGSAVLYTCMAAASSRRCSRFTTT
jgi:hypothetical protein